jgi:hypothetical protein
MWASRTVVLSQSDKAYAEPGKSPPDAGTHPVDVAIDFLMSDALCKKEVALGTQVRLVSINVAPWVQPVSKDVYATVTVIVEPVNGTGYYIDGKKQYPAPDGA